jgi:hypothetical protein
MNGRLPAPFETVGTLITARHIGIGQSDEAILLASLPVQGTRRLSSIGFDRCDLRSKGKR